MTKSKSKENMTAWEKITLEARNEINEELMDKYKSRLKEKYRGLANAKNIVKNIENEITDLEIKIQDELS